MTTNPELSLAVNGRERQLLTKLVIADGQGSTPAGTRTNADEHTTATAAIVGLGYVGLPTALALNASGCRTVGVDVSANRLRAIRAGEVDLIDADRETLAAALVADTLRLGDDPSVLRDADAVIICVPTPVDSEHVPELSALRAACGAVVEHARVGQTIILTSTTFVGTTRQMLVEPLRARGLRVGVDVFVAFSPERIDPGNPDHVQHDTPRVVGGTTPACADRAAEVVSRMTDVVYLVSSPEAAEATKLYENIFRAVTLALANEFADVCGTLVLDPIEVTLAASTKPYGFLATLPGPGVGGHCIPCDPYYLLWQLEGRSTSGAPLISEAMRAIDLRPGRVAERAAEVLAETGGTLAGARVLVLGVSYKPGVRDLRESSALPLIDQLLAAGAEVSYFDPLIPEIRLPGDRVMRGLPSARAEDWDLVIAHTLHPGIDYSWAADCVRVLDATYRFDAAPHRAVV